MNFLLNYCQRKQYIYCYGAGYYGRIIYAFLKDNNIEIEGFIVTDKGNQTLWKGKEILEVNEIDSRTEIGIIVAVGNRYRGDVKNTLQMLGYKDVFFLTTEELEGIAAQISYKFEQMLSPKVCILYYHRICNLSLDTWRVAVSPSLFEEHINYLKENFQILRLEDDWSDIRQASVAITFDDGYADILHQALPILEKYQVPATVFVATGNIDRKQEFWWDQLEQIIFDAKSNPKSIKWRSISFCLRSQEDKNRACYEIHGYLKSMTTENRREAIKELADFLDVEISFRQEKRSMTSSELRQLAQSSCIEIGGHTVTHPSLAMEQIQRQKEEIQSSKNWLEKKLGKRITTFSYPFGGKEDFLPTTKKVLCELGYQKIATTIPGLADPSTDKLELPRIWISNDCTVDQLARHLRRTWYFYG